MLVYGDPSFSITPSKIASGLERLLREAADSPDGRRELLIACGQLEQAVADSGTDDSYVRTLTDAAAHLFLAGADEGSDDLRNFKLPPVDPIREISTALKIKVPEGFAFYTLFPEQYSDAAKAWLSEGEQRGPTLVAGIRSIGTGLSALVAAVLRSEGVTVQRLTVRPTGDPFERQVEIRTPGSEFTHAIVVDEGPGLSGSSIAATVSALQTAGIHQICIFPGHAHEPGSAAPDRVRKIWGSTPRLVFPTLAGDFRHSPLVVALKQRTEALLNAAVTDAADLSAGAWRNFYPEGQALDAVPELERTKFLFKARDGRAILWKYAGLGCGHGFTSLAGEAFLRQKRLARIGWCLAPLEVYSGFIATPWSPGAHPETATVSISRALARYVLDSARPAPDERENHFERLRTITRQNIEKAFSAEVTRVISPLIEAASPVADLPNYGDGRLGPSEWMHAGGKLVKSDVWGHDSDHTCVGPQSVLWDIAGAIEEWRLQDDLLAAFLTELRTAGLEVPKPALDFYRLAYASFRLAIALMFGNEPLERRWRPRAFAAVPNQRSIS